jgi:hypothetical protein
MEYHEIEYFNHWHELGVEAERAEHEKMKRKMAEAHG